MKELYQSAELEVVKFTVADIITSSTLTGGAGGPNETEIDPL